MRCERCGARIRGATWYCPGCGAPVRDLNVADSVAGGNWRPLLRRLLPPLISLAFLAAVGGAGWALWRAAAERFGAADRVEPSASAMPPASTEPVTATLEAVSTAADVTADGGTLRTRPGAPVWRVRPLSAPPTLDGNLDDWQAPLIDAAPLAVTALVFGAEAWQGAADLSATAWGAYDDRALYLAVAVRDDRFTQTSRGAELYLGDSLELQVDADLPGDWDRRVFDADDWHIGLSPGMLTAGGTAPEAWVWRPQERRGALVLPLAAAARPSGYAVEVALPWMLLGLEPAQGLSLGLTVSVSDDDAPDPAQESMVSSSAGRRWDDPTTMGILVLDP